MGAPMIGHLLDAGHELIVHTRRREAAQPLLERGARYAATPADAARGAEFVCTNVTRTADVGAVLFDVGGVAEGAAPGTVACLGRMPFNLGNAVKYIWRAGSKGDTLDDLRKAEFYLDDFLRSATDFTRSPVERTMIYRVIGYESDEHRVNIFEAIADGYIIDALDLLRKWIEVVSGE